MKKNIPCSSLHDRMSYRIWRLYMSLVSWDKLNDPIVSSWINRVVGVLREWKPFVNVVDKLTRAREFVRIYCIAKKENRELIIRARKGVHNQFLSTMPKNWME